MRIRSKVMKFTGDRKVVEIPINVRDNFRIGETVFIEKIKRLTKSPESKEVKG